MALGGMDAPGNKKIFHLYLFNPVSGVRLVEDNTLCFGVNYPNSLPVSP